MLNTQLTVGNVTADLGSLMQLNSLSCIDISFDAASNQNSVSINITLYHACTTQCNTDILTLARLNIADDATINT